MSRGLSAGGGPLLVSPSSPTAPASLPARLPRAGAASY